MSHLHYDHAGALDCFPAARVHVQRDERDFAANPPIYQAGGYVRADFGGAIDWHEIDGEHARTLAERALPAVLWHPDLMVASWARLERVAAEHNALLIFPHDPEFRSWLRLAPEQFYV